MENQGLVAAHRIEVAYQNVAKMSDEDRQAIDAIMAAYSLAQWEQLIPEIQNVLTAVSTDAAVDYIRQRYYPKMGVPEFTAQMHAEAKIRGAFDRVNHAAVAYAKDRAAEMVGRKWVDGELVENPDAQWAITDSTREWLREAVSSAFQDGMSPAQLGNAIRESQAFSKSRAKMIAHTEIGNANLATLEASAIDAKATSKRTSLSANHDHDDVCDDAADRGEVPIDYVYANGMTRPLFHPRCQCAISYYVRRKRKQNGQAIGQAASEALDSPTRRTLYQQGAEAP